MIAFVGRALAALLCAMTAPHPPLPDLPPIQPRPEPPPDDSCVVCLTQPRRAGDYCGDTCQARWVANRNRAIPLPAAPPALPDGSTYRRTT